MLKWILGPLEYFNCSKDTKSQNTKYQRRKLQALYSAKSLKQKQSKEFTNETYKTKLNFKSTMNLSFGKCSGRGYLKKQEWGIGERNEGNDGNGGNQGGTWGIGVGIIFQYNL